MRKADDLLGQFLDAIGQPEGAAYVGLFRGWRRIVGDRIADHAEPVDLRGSALVVEADHPGWVQMIMISQARILRQVQKQFPELSINALHIRVAGDRAAGATAGTEDRHRAAPPIPPTPPSKSEAEALEHIEDDDLRTTLERLRGSLDAPDE